MKITYLRLENVAGLIVGSNKKFIEIDFSKSMNKIVAIQGPNGIGKTVLLSSLSPFASTTSLDERSSLPYIKNGLSGYKEIRYQTEKSDIVIKHYYKPNKTGKHSIKSYISVNDEELNENGNVTSFIDLVEMHLSITPDMMRLMRLGSNVKSIISLSPTERKHYIGQLITHIDAYLKIYKKVNDDLRRIKILRASNATNIQKCHISDPLVESKICENITNEIKQLESEYDSMVSKLGKVQGNIDSYGGIESVKSEIVDIRTKLNQLDFMKQVILDNGLINIDVKDLIAKVESLDEKISSNTSEVNSLRMMNDANNKSIERLTALINRSNSNSDISSIKSAIESLTTSINSVPEFITKMPTSVITSNEVDSVISRLSAFNKISTMIYTFDDIAIKTIVKLYDRSKSVDEFLKKQLEMKTNGMNFDIVRRLMDDIFERDSIISPLCSIETSSKCPYYRISRIVNDTSINMETRLEDETLNYISIISKNIDEILNEINLIRADYKFPDSLLTHITESAIMNRFKNRFNFFDISPFMEYMNILREHELYVSNITKLNSMESQLSAYVKSGIDVYNTEIENIRVNSQSNSIRVQELIKISEDLKVNIDSLNKSIRLIDDYGNEFPKRDKYNSDLSRLEDIEKDFNSAISIQRDIDLLKVQLNYKREELKGIENRISRYGELIDESDKLASEFEIYSIIEESVSTRKGIPVIYMQKYLSQIQDLSNNLLEFAYDGELKLSNFNVTQDSFEIPYNKSGTVINDVKYSSQSELSLMTMALSFALLTRASENYNIILLDEIDSGLDDSNRSAFLKMLDRQMQLLNSSQVFIISHNMNQMINMPMDLIQLSDDDCPANSMQNIIY